MASAQLAIDQATLAPAGVAGKARLDGLIGGELVTLTSTDPGTTNKFRVLFAPDTDTTAIATLAPNPAGGAEPVWEP